MKWLEKTGMLYTSHHDRAGRIRTFQQMLLSDLLCNIPEICTLRNLDKAAADYDIKKREIKSLLQCFALNELQDRKTVTKHSGLMQIDFDKKDCEGYDIEELKQAIFSLHFIAFIGRSCSGEGFYAIAAIAEPERQKEYAQHIFEVLKSYGLSCDTSKGRNYNDLRYASYDANMMWREEVEPLKITFKPKQQQPILYKSVNPGLADKTIDTCINNILNTQKGQRWETVQKAAYTLGGIGTHEAMAAIETAIFNNTAFNGEADKYLKCAKDCFSAGQLQPLTINQ